MGGLIACTMLAVAGGRPARADGRPADAVPERPDLADLARRDHEQAGRAAGRRQLRPSPANCAAISSSTRSSSAIPAARLPALNGFQLSHRGRRTRWSSSAASGRARRPCRNCCSGLYQPTEGAVHDRRRRYCASSTRPTCAATSATSSQDPTLFYGTLRDNIAIGAPYADDAAIVAAAEVAGLTRVRQPPPGRLRHADRRARRVAFRRPAPGRRDRPRLPDGSADPAARRADQLDGFHLRAAVQGAPEGVRRRTRR